VVEGEVPPDVEEYRLGGGIVVRLPKKGAREAWERAKRVVDILIGAGE